MAEPVFSDATERLYGRLPQVYRSEDEGQDWLLKKWLSGVVDQLGDVEVLIDRFAYVTPDEGVPNDTSDLVDPVTADAEWLPWLAQLVGVKLPTGDEASRRALISSPAKFKAGTKAAIKAAVQTVLTGEKHVEVYDHSTDSSTIGAAGQWDVLIVTRGTETSSDPIAAVIALGAKPAGVKLWAKTYSTTWDALEAGMPTWTGWDARTWSEVEETGL